jgi:hypothetical protein
MIYCIIYIYISIHSLLSIYYVSNEILIVFVIYQIAPLSINTLFTVAFGNCFKHKIWKFEQMA